VISDVNTFYRTTEISLIDPKVMPLPVIVMDVWEPQTEAVLKLEILGLL
jgi:hypothetical protein